MNAYQLLSDIYRILGEIDHSVIAHALKQNRDPRVKKILHAFGAAAGTRDTIGPLPTSHVPVSSKRPTAKPVPQPEYEPVHLRPSLQPNHTLRGFQSLTRISPNRSNRDWINLLNRSGLSLQSRSKESRQRLLTRAAQQFKKLPTHKQGEIFKRLRALVGTDETSGWMQIIQSFSRE